MIKIYESQKTGECGCICYVLKNLIGHDWQGKPFLNLRWKRIE